MKKIVLCIIALLMTFIACASSSAPVQATNTVLPAVVTNSLTPEMDVEDKDIDVVIESPNVEIIMAALESSAMDLDAAIKAAALKMGTSLPAKTEVALVSLASTSAQLSEYIISRLEAALVDDGKLIVLDRANLDRVREEQGFQLSGEVDDKSAKDIGKMLGAGAIVTGSFINLGDVYGLSLKAINMKTAAIAVSYPADIVKSTRIETLLASGGGATSGGGRTSPAVAGARPTAAVQSTSQSTAQAASTPAPANFVRVVGGTFQMGSEGIATPVHAVTIKSFYMGKFEVTQKEWIEVMGSNPSDFKGDNLPVENVSWFDAIDYCNRRSLKEGLTPAYRGSGDGVTCNFSASGYRLPTEAEWEYAAKGGVNSEYITAIYSGSSNADGVAWHGGNSGGKTHPVGTKQPNDLGLYDMSGNVREWCWDRYGRYEGETQTNPAGAASGSHRVLRGGSWYYDAEYLRSASRDYDSPTSRNYRLGFRIVRP